jgi:hypothetical protein
MATNDPYSTSVTSTTADATPANLNDSSTTQTVDVTGTKAPTALNLQSMQGSTDWSVDPKTQTVAGQLGTIMSADSPLMQQARTRAMQSMNQRGLTNSSMATSAADSAMYDTALKIAQPDAQTNASAAQTNTATKNQFANTANTQAYDTNKYNTETTNQFADKANQFAYDSAKLGTQTKAATDVAAIEAQYKNLTQGSASATAIVNKMQDSLNALMANKDITDQTKRDTLAADIKANAAESLNLIGALAGDVNLSDYISQVGL